MAERDLYKILDIERSASRDDIRKAYRRLARKHHPDVNQNDPKAAERFKDVSFANDVLSDDEKRKLYDEFGESGLASGFDADQARAWKRWQDGRQRSPYGSQVDSGIDLEDLLSGFSGPGRRASDEDSAFFGGLGRRARGPRRGADTEGSITVDFLDAVRGRQVALSVDGRGQIKVTLPPGTVDGTRIRLAGQGGTGPGKAPPGDLYLTVRLRPHPFFRREGDDIHLALPVTVSELLRGATVRLPTPDGAVDLRIPARSPNGRKLRVRGKGATRHPTADNTAPQGDLYAELVATLPEGGDQSSIEKVALELDALYAGQDVRRGLGAGR